MIFVMLNNTMMVLIVVGYYVSVYITNIPGETKWLWRVFRVLRNMYFKKLLQEFVYL